ncbi:MAG TPA: hypothetical protein VNW90_11790 [Acetobacteraceae bacterium]|jgi:hypothetical protein|nr:hypothetical protein [Acetobacteraceae bacterium]
MIQTLIDSSGLVHDGAALSARMRSEPYWRRGHWRHYGSHSIWIRPQAIKRGKGALPPWYEARRWAIGGCPDRLARRSSQHRSAAIGTARNALSVPPRGHHPAIGDQRLEIGIKERAMAFMIFFAILSIISVSAHARCDVYDDLGSSLAGPQYYVQVVDAVTAKALDGSYVQNVREQTIMNPNSRCMIAAEIASTLTILNSHFAIHFGNEMKDIEIGADGTFDTHAAWRTGGFGHIIAPFSIKGAVVGHELQMDISNPNCRTHFLFKKSN